MVEPANQTGVLRRSLAENHSANPLISLIVPTLNEAENLRHLVRRVDRALRRLSFEIIIVDDGSTDGTGDIGEALAAERDSIRIIRRSPAERGLSTAILTGFQAARGDHIAVIDADLQHDPAVLPRLVESLATSELAIASRYAFKGRTCKWSYLRELESRAAAWLTRLVLGIRVRDPLSGFFAMRRLAFRRVAAELKPRGWKLLLDVLAAGPDLRVTEVPLTFRARCRGETKMNWRVVSAWLGSLPGLRRIRRERLRQVMVSSPPRQVIALP